MRVDFVPEIDLLGDLLHAVSCRYPALFGKNAAERIPPAGGQKDGVRVDADGFVMYTVVVAAVAVPAFLASVWAGFALVATALLFPLFAWLTVRGR